MTVSTNATPEPWMQAKLVKKQCPNSSNRQAKKALMRFNGDVDKAVSYLNSQVRLKYAEPTDFDAQYLQDKKREGSHVTSSSSSVVVVDEALPTSKADDQEQEDSFSWLSGLPSIPLSSSPLRAEYDGEGFDLYNVISGIQSGSSADLIREYLALYKENDRVELEENINGDIEGFPAIFYIVETDNTELIRHWVRYGGDLNATYGPTRFPLLAFAILRDSRPRIKAAETLRTLLSLGASPDVIPSEYYCPYNKELPESGPEKAEPHNAKDGNHLWCNRGLRRLLASCLSLTQRYRLYQASKADPCSGRKRVLLYRKDAEQVLGLHMLIIGQEMAVNLLKQKIITHLAMSREKPLVLLFAGPSGHGKTELARKFGELMSLDLLTVDCTMFTREDELFGPKPPYQGYQAGSPLNNFLATMSGRKSIVFMDEFEKTSKEVRNALLLPFENGEYMDRRISMKVNCSETIWILATNAFDDTIHEFCRTNRKAIFNNNTAGSRHSSLMKQLSARLREECVSHLGAPLTGRIAKIVPFLTFSPDEAAVVADKGIMELEARLAQPVKLPPTKQGDNLVGNIRLDVTNDCVVCSKVADDRYVPGLGARSIFVGVDEVIADPLVDQYLENGEDFAEDQKETRFTVGVDSGKEVDVWLTPAENHAVSSPRNPPS